MSRVFTMLYFFTKSIGIFYYFTLFNMRKYLLYGLGIAIILVIVIAVIAFTNSAGLEKFAYDYFPHLYGSFYRQGMVYQPKFTSELTEYANKKEGIKISYPNGWVVQDTFSPQQSEFTPVVEIGESIYLKTPSNAYPDELFSGYENLTDVEKKMTLSQLMAEQIEQYKSYAEEQVTIKDSGLVTTNSNGMKGFFITYDEKYSDGTVLSHKDTLFVRNDRLYHFNYQDTASEFSGDLPVADKMIASISFF